MSPLTDEEVKARLKAACDRLAGRAHGVPVDAPAAPLPAPPAGAPPPPVSFHERHEREPGEEG